jgi:hypothetical protein
MIQTAAFSHACRTVLTAVLAFAGLHPMVSAADPQSGADGQGAADGQNVIVVVGASGTEEYGEIFRQWAEAWQQAAEAGTADCTVIGLQPSDNDLDQVRSTVQQQAVVQSLEPLWIVLIGHGTFDGRVARFNLNGRDMAAEDLAEWLQGSARPIAVVNCASCSSPFINAVSGPGRVVISATKDGNETQFCRFGQFMAAAVSGTEADIDRDGQTSLLEAWLFASRRTDEFYESDGRLATEHALLDDSGDQLGVRTNVFEGVRVKDSIQDRDQIDGRLAHRWHLVRSEAERLLTAEQRLRRDQLEQQLEELRLSRSQYEEAAYLDALEQILIPLARLYEEAASKPAAASPETRR